MRPVSVRRTARLGACIAVAAGLLTAALAASASASAEEQSDQLWIQAPSEQNLLLGGSGGGSPQSRALDATGRVVLTSGGPGGTFPFDPKPENNTAKVMVNAAPEA
ncbi:hypothetical protein [Streptomyces sp. Ncost-T10-10d]|uniref:hypothetical protein n=1 Tax=Streptomyces sp. Ncost-T10-10d TaxID=1839774 RepID=UPI00081F49AC|nr:hypothetical protein [Streptomyces sp. Ncost-T10-10d]SCF56563.1 hypothetical protein GA0115254_101116 [Streptomyces sp. Ncost-T10-10d]